MFKKNNTAEELPEKVTLRETLQTQGELSGKINALQAQITALESERAKLEDGIPDREKQLEAALIDLFSDKISQEEYEKVENAIRADRKRIRTLDKMVLTLRKSLDGLQAESAKLQEVK